MNRYGQDGGYCPHCGQTRQVNGYGGGQSELAELRRRIDALERRAGVGIRPGDYISINSMPASSWAQYVAGSVDTSMPQATPGNPICGEK